jgi:hypothetical protein
LSTIASKEEELEYTGAQTQLLTPADQALISDHLSKTSNTISTIFNDLEDRFCEDTPNHWVHEFQVPFLFVASLFN